MMPAFVYRYAMSDLHIYPLPALARPLLEKFYRSHRSPMRLPAQGQAWVVKEAQIVAALCLTPVRHGHWLTGLFVAASWRGQGLARRLIDQAHSQCSGPLWLFCHPDLQGFYQSLGFVTAVELPTELAERLARYQRSKALVALLRDQSSALGSRSGNSTSVNPN